MEKILITDTHFGTRQNSINWLNTQLKFMYEQLIPYIESRDNPVHLIHLGDVFDARSSVSTLIASKVYDLFSKLCSICDKVTIICGNHDYYSPNSDTINTVMLIFRDLNINIIHDNIYIDGSDMYIPWFEWFKKDKINELLNQHKIDNIFTHADIVTNNPGYKNINIYSGHMHTPVFKEKQGIFNLGSCFSLDFNDKNSTRGFYSLNNGILNRFVNEKSIRFYRFYNEDILNEDKIKHIKPGDYIEIYIKSNYMLQEQYQNIIKELSNLCKNIWIIPQSINHVDMESVDIQNYDIDYIIANNIPKKLIDKFNKIKCYEE